MSEPVLDVFASEYIYRTTLTVPENGFYNVDFFYSHDNWDTWMKLDIVGENGETVCYIPPLPKKYKSTTMLLYLFAGTNRITAAPRFDQPTVITNIALSDKVPTLSPSITPSGDRFYLDKPKDRRILVISYTGAPIGVTDGDTVLPFETEKQSLYENSSALEPMEQKEPFNHYHIKLSADTLRELSEGVHELTILLPQEQKITYTLHVEKNASESAFKIVSLNVGHGNCTLLRLPNGKNLLIDTGIKSCAKEVILPYLEKHGLSVDYCLITHFHGDHIGCLDQILDRYPLSVPKYPGNFIKTSAEERTEYLSRFKYLDSSMLCRYDRLDKIWDLGGVEITVLNSRFDQNGDPIDPNFRDENQTSVSMLVKYNGFSYYHGADNEAPNQKKTLADFTAWGKVDELACHYMLGNHHFHGDLDTAAIRAINPVAILVPANAALYSRSAFMVDFMQEVAKADFAGKRLKDLFVSYFSGTVTVSVNSGDDWHYETD